MQVDGEHVDDSSTVLIIHPMLSSASGIMAALCEHMGPGLRLLVPDLSAHGDKASIPYVSAALEAAAVAPVPHAHSRTLSEARRSRATARPESPYTNRLATLTKKSSSGATRSQTMTQHLRVAEHPRRTAVPSCIVRHPFQCSDPGAPDPYSHATPNRSVRHLLESQLRHRSRTRIGYACADRLFAYPRARNLSICS